MSQQPWTTVCQSEGKLREHVRAHTALTEEPRSSTGAHMEPGQGLCAMVPVARGGGKGGSRKTSGAKWLAILAELMNSRFNGPPCLKGRGWRASDRTRGHLCVHRTLRSTRARAWSSLRSLLGSCCAMTTVSSLCICHSTPCKNRGPGKTTGPRDDSQTRCSGRRSGFQSSTHTQTHNQL